MFAATPRWRDQLDARTVLLVAVVALGVFGLEMVLLARTVASPLGGMIADLDRIPQVDVGPVPEYAKHLPTLHPDGSLNLRLDAPVCFAYP